MTYHKKRFIKKFLLFILILFGTLSIQSLAGGCNAQICICPDGSSVSANQYCPVPSNNNYGGGSTYSWIPGKHYWFILPSLNNKNYQFVNLNTTDSDTAWNRYLTYESYFNISKADISQGIDSKSYSAWALSEDGQIFWGVSVKGKKGTELKMVKNKCKKAGVKSCEIILKLDGKTMKLTDLRDNTTTQLKVTYSFK